MVRQEFIVERNGKSFVLYAGLLDLAHAQGLRRITTRLLQIPSEDNGQMAIVSAEVETDRGTFSGIGDAGPSNVARQMLTVTIRLAETRAKARALRDAVNVGVAALEELGDVDQTEVGEGRSPSPVDSMNARPVPIRSSVGDEPATPAQRQAIARLAGQGGWAVNVDTLTKSAAGALIRSLQQEGHAPSA